MLTIGHQMLGYSLSAKVDASRLEQSDTSRFTSCLAAWRDKDAPAGITPNLLAFTHFGILVAAEERDMIDIISCAAGIPFVPTETVARGVMGMIFVGSLAQWRDAVKTGTSPTVEHNVRALYCNVMTLFEKEGLADAWKDFIAKPLHDNTFFLEDKR